MFETINSNSEKTFLELFAKARSKEMSKNEFVSEMTKTEFAALRQMRKLLLKINLDASKTVNSYYYKRMIDCPDNFDDFLVYRKKVASPYRDAGKEREALYDQLQMQ